MTIDICIHRKIINQAFGDREPMAESGSNERGKERGREGERVTDGYRERKRDNIGITEIQREKDERQTR